jgi:hypothetical protein
MLPLAFATATLFSAPIEVGCLSRFEDEGGLRLSGADVYHAGYEDLLICRYPFSAQSFEKVVSADYLTDYTASDAGLFAARRGYVYFYPRAPQQDAEPVGSAENSWDPQAPFHLAVSPGGLAAVVVGDDARLLARTGAAGAGTWDAVSTPYVSRDLSAAQMTANGLYYLTDDGFQINWAHLDGTVSTYHCPRLCEALAGSADGVYFVSARGLFRWDAAGTVTTIREAGFFGEFGCERLFGADDGVYVHYRPSTGHDRLAFFDAGGGEAVVVDHDAQLYGVIAGNAGAFVQKEHVMTPWQFYARQR